MAYLNRIEIIGNLGHEPKIANTTNNKKATLSIACTERYTKDGEKKSVTYWFTAVYWGRMADVVANLHLEKGTCVYVGGKMTFRSWDDENGVKHQVSEIVGENLQILSSKRSDGTYQPTANAPTAEAEEDELPF